MDCLEFRRQLNIDPHCADAAFARHRQECPRCAEAQQRAIAFEASLRRALQIPVPEQLAESILLTQATRQHRRMRRYARRGGWLALAATAVLAVGIGWHAHAHSLPSLAVAHVTGEELPAMKLTADLPAAAVRGAFARRGVELPDVPADISYVQCCPLGRYRTVHMVMPGAKGAVAVLYIVGDRVGERNEFARNGWHGRSVPLAHGTLVLVAHNAERFDRLETVWRNALDDAS